MALNWKTGSFNKSGTTTGLPFTVAHITGLSFQPKALLLFSNGTNSSFSDNIRPSIGFTAGSTQNYSIGWGSNDNRVLTVTAPAVDTVTFKRAYDDACICTGTSSSTTVSKLKLSTFNADGATFQYVDANDTGTYSIYYIALGGADITNVKAGSFDLNTTTGPQTVSSVGFTPDIVFFIGANTPALGTSIANAPNGQWFMGAAKSSTAQGVSTGLSVDGLFATSATARYQRTDQCIAYLDETGTTSTYTKEAEAALTSMNSDGFTINVSTAPAVSQPVFYLAIKGGSWSLGSFTEPASLGDQAITSTQGHGAYTPKGVFMWSDAEAALTTISNHHRYYFGTATSSTAGDMFAITGGDTNNVTTTVSTRGTTTSETIRLFREAAISDATNVDVTGSASLTTLDSGGFTVNWADVTDASAATLARQILYVTAGDSISGTALIKSPATTPEAIGITEPTIVKRRDMARQTSTNPETIGLTEATPIKSLGKVKIIGGLAPTTTGFIDPGFISTGFTVVPQDSDGTVTVSDFLTGDFVTTDFAVSYETTIHPEDTLTISESVSKVLNVFQGLVTAGNLVLKFSGGASYNGNLNGGITSLGGAISATVVTSNVLDTAWDDVAFSEATSGKVEFRCFYLYNNHASLTAYSVDMWIDMNTPGGDTIEIGVGAANVNATEAALSPLAENTVPPAPVTFSLATDADSAIHLGNIPASGYKSFWIKRNVPASTFAWNDNSYTIRISFVSDHT